jgi:hypothetical protein
VVQGHLPDADQQERISALQIHRMIGTGSYRTAWYMCHRIRAGLAEEGFRELLGLAASGNICATFSAGTVRAS